MKLRILILAGLLTATLTGCSKDDKSDGKGEPKFSLFSLSNDDSQVNRNQILQIADLDGKPVPKAQILIGTSQDQPFAGNFLTADDSGVFTAPDAWTGEQVITISAPGFIRASFFGQTPQGQTFQLRPAVATSHYQLSGKGTGFQTKDQDNLIDFAMMMPAVKRQDLFAFDLTMFISPEVDVMNVMGQSVRVPTNVSLPSQSETYGFFPVTLAKPVYKLNFDTLGQHRVVTVRGQFPFSDVVGQMQANKPFLSLINYFSLKGGSLKQVDVKADNQTMDLPVNELTFNQPKKLTTPTYGQDQFLVAAAMSSFQGDFFPTDFKNIPSHTASTLNTAAGDPPYLLMALKMANDSALDGKLSAVFVPFTDGVSPTLLPMIDNPQVTATDVKIQVPSTLPSGLTPVATYLVYSTVEKSGSGATAKEKVTRLWEVYAKNWQSDFHMPQWPHDTITDSQSAQRWDVSLLATKLNGKDKAVDLNPRILETVTHATHSATDF